jgi:hypothetical protein
MVSRVFVIILALGAAAYRFSTGAVFEAIGVAALAAGLLFLRAAERQPQFRRYADLSFSVTAGIMAYVMYRNAQ